MERYCIPINSQLFEESFRTLYFCVFGFTECGFFFYRLRLYYNMQMSDIISQMQAMYKLQRTPGTEELLKETKRVLTDNYMFEETVLPTLPCSNAGLYAMNLHYSTSLESLNIMLKQMENMEDFNRNSKQ